MTTYKIPASIAAAQRELGALGELLTATEWERAAIVFAFTVDGRSKVVSSTTAPLTYRDFASLGIIGLTSVESVRFFRSQWERAMTAGASPAKPGTRVDLPTLDWADHEDARQNRRYVERSEGAVARSIDRQDLDAEVLAQNLSDEAAEAVVARIREDRPDVASRGMVRHLQPARVGLQRMSDAMETEHAKTETVIEDQLAIRALDQGVHRFTMRATDAYGNKGRTTKLARHGEEKLQKLQAAMDLLRGFITPDEIGEDV